jgi:hypothetical protein
MDYSLLLGVHRNKYKLVGDRDNLDVSAVFALCIVFALKGRRPLGAHTLAMLGCATFV